MPETTKDLLTELDRLLIGADADDTGRVDASMTASETEVRYVFVVRHEGVRVTP